MFPDMERIMEYASTNHIEYFNGYPSIQEMISSKVNDELSKGGNIFENIPFMTCSESQRESATIVDEDYDIQGKDGCCKESHNKEQLNYLRDKQCYIKSRSNTQVSEVTSQISPNFLEELSKCITSNHTINQRNFDNFSLDKGNTINSFQCAKNIQNQNTSIEKIKESDEIYNNKLTNVKKETEEISKQTQNTINENKEPKASNKIKKERKKQKRSKKDARVRRNAYGTTLLEAIKSLYRLKEAKKATYKNHRGKIKKFDTTRAAKELNLQKKTMDYYRLQFNKAIALGESLIVLDFYLKQSFGILSKKVNEILKQKSKEELHIHRKICKNNDTKKKFDLTIDKFYHIN